MTSNEEAELAAAVANQAHAERRYEEATTDAQKHYHDIERTLWEIYVAQLTEELRGNR